MDYSSNVLCVRVRPRTYYLLKAKLYDQKKSVSTYLTELIEKDIENEPNTHS